MSAAPPRRAPPHRCTTCTAALHSSAADPLPLAPHAQGIARTPHTSPTRLPLCPPPAHPLQPVCLPTNNCNTDACVCGPSAPDCRPSGLCQVTYLA